MRLGKQPMAALGPKEDFAILKKGEKADHVLARSVTWPAYSYIPAMHRGGYKDCEQMSHFQSGESASQFLYEETSNEIAF